MTIAYCRDDPDSRWTGLDRLLTEFEVDYNFYQHETRIAALEADITTTVSIGEISQPSSTTLLFTLTDGSTQGPFTLPVSTFRDRGEWAAATPYLVNDTFTANGGLYRVIFAHTSGETFSATANDGAGHDYYAAMLASPGNALPTGGAAGMFLRKSSSTDFAVSWAFPLPNGGSTNQVLAKTSDTDQAFAWTSLSASIVTFTPSTASALTSDTVADALEELEALVASGGGVNASAVAFDPSTASALVSTNVAAALEELEGLIGGGGGDFLPLSGGTMTGPIELAADPASLMQPATKQYVDAAVDGIGANDVAFEPSTASGLTSTDVAAALEELEGMIGTGGGGGSYLPLSGGTLTGALTLAGDPATDLGAATKQYVDNNFALDDLSNVDASTARGTLGVADGAIEVVIDGGGSAITTGLKGFLRMPFGGTITEAVMLANQTGSIVVDVWKCSYSQFDAGSTHPVSGDKITASAPPTISSAVKSQDTTLTGWTTTFSAGDILGFNVNSAATIKRVTLSLKIRK